MTASLHRPATDEQIAAYVAGEIAAVDHRSEVLGYDAEQSAARRADVETRARARAKVVPNNAWGGYMIGMLKPLPVAPDEIEKYMWATSTERDDRRTEWQITYAIRQGYPSWFYMTCTSNDDLRTAGPPTREYYEWKEQFDADAPRRHEEFRTALKEALPEIIATIRDIRAQTPAPVSRVY